MKLVSTKLVLIRSRVHPFPSRTRKLSSILPTILGWRRPGKIGNANIIEQDSLSTVLFFCHLTPSGTCRTETGLELEKVANSAVQFKKRIREISEACNRKGYSTPINNGVNEITDVVQASKAQDLRKLLPHVSG